MVAKIRKILLQTKIKLGWHICKADDYVVAMRCFRCSRYNQRRKEFKCVNCKIYNKFNPHKTCTNHSSLDKKCPNMLAILERYRMNTEY